LTVKFQLGTSLRTQGRIEMTVPALYTDPTSGATQAVLDSSLTTPQVTSASDGTTKAITISSRSFLDSRLLLTIDFLSASTL
jgi:hypothetical protein